MKLFRNLLIMLLAMCTAFCVLFTACGGDNNDKPNGDQQTPGGTTKPGDDDNKDPVTPAEGTKENPIVLGEVGSTEVSVKAGETIYYRLSLAAAPADKYYRVYSTNTNALFTSGGNTGSDIELVISGLRYEFSLKTANGAADNVTFNLELATPSKPGESADDPLLLMNDGDLAVSIEAGATVYYRFMLRNSVEISDTTYYTVASDNDNVVFTCGSATGAEVRLSASGANERFYDFSVAVDGGAAAQFTMTITLHAPAGSEYNPHVASVGENSLHFSAAGETVYHKFTAPVSGFYIITSECDSLTALESVGFEDENILDNFRIITYVTDGGTLELAITLKDGYEGDPSELTFNIEYVNDATQGTQENPYELHIGDVCLFAVPEGAPAIYVKVVDDQGNGVDATLFSPNTSADFNGANSKYDCSDGGAVSVEYAYGTPTFVVNAPEA